MHACAWMRFCLQVCLSTSNIQAWSPLIVLMMLWLPPWLPLQFQHKKNPKQTEKPDTRLNLCKRVTLSSTITNGSDTHTHRKKNPRHMLPENPYKFSSFAFGSKTAGMAMTNGRHGRSKAYKEKEDRRRRNIQQELYMLSRRKAGQCCSVVSP